MRIHLCAALLSLVLCSDVRSQESSFWSWFNENSHRFTHFESDDGTLGSELYARLAAFHKGLVYEISAPKDGIRELIISGDGLRENIPFVQELTRDAPEITGWRVVAFRPRLERYSEFALTYHGRDFDPSQLWIFPRASEDTFDLIIYHPKYSDADRNLIVSGTYILLDMALGEYDVMTGVRYLDHQQLPIAPEDSGLIPFSQLRSVFDTWRGK